MRSFSREESRVLDMRTTTRSATASKPPPPFPALGVHPVLIPWEDGGVLQQGDSEDDHVSPRWQLWDHLSEGPNHPKQRWGLKMLFFWFQWMNYSSIPSWPSSPVSLPWPDRSAFPHFPSIHQKSGFVSFSPFAILQKRIFSPKLNLLSHTGTAILCNISYSSLLTSFVKGN